MYAINDKIIYGQTGVCVVANICEKEFIKGQKRQYYVLKPLYKENSTIYAPVHSDKVFMRPCISRAEAEELISEIPKIMKCLAEKEYSNEEYRGCFYRHNCADLVKLTLHIYRKKETARKNRKRLGFSDEKYMLLAENLLFGELACALEIPLESVKEYIEKKIGNK
ncbi:MAG: CarD family transcriptional regulator [Acutalibacteraceae bacterium]|jgi:CarD family transcriptional regulator